MTTPAQSAAPEAPVEPQVGTPEYEAAMAAAGASVSINNAPPEAPPAETPATTPAAPERPSWLPEKFKSAEDMAKAYSELETKLSTPPETPPATPPAEPPASEKSANDLSKFFSEFEANGALSDGSYQELAKAGFDKAIVDNYIAGQQAIATARTQAGFAAVGGESNYRQMTDWAAANLTPAEIKAFNAQTNGSHEAAMLAVQGLQAKYQAAVGRAPQGLLGGNASSTTSSGGFQSRAQVTQAMSDPRYDSDPAYRASVVAKLAQTADSVI